MTGSLKYTNFIIFNKLMVIHKKALYNHFFSFKNENQSKCKTISRKDKREEKTVLITFTVNVFLVDLR